MSRAPNNSHRGPHKMHLYSDICPEAEGKAEEQSSLLADGGQNKMILQNQRPGYRYILPWIIVGALCFLNLTLITTAYIYYRATGCSATDFAKGFNTELGMLKSVSFSRGRLI